MGEQRAIALESAAVLKALANTRKDEPLDIDQIMANFTNAPLGDDRAGWLQMAGIVSSDKMAGDLYLASVAWADRRWREIKDWGYLKAVEYVGARKSPQRKRSMVESYRLDWGHQAARDGLAIALWGKSHVPGSRERALHFKCGQQAYRRVRDEVGGKASELIAEFRHFVNMARTQQFSHEFIDRWEIATGNKWPHA